MDEFAITWNRRSNLSFVSSRWSAVFRTTISSPRGDRLREFADWCARARQITHPRECDAAVDQRISRCAQTRRAFGVIDQIDCRRAEDFLSGFSPARKSIERDPTETLTLPRIERYLPETLNELQVEQLIESIDTKQPLGLRDRAMIELLYASGLRISELANARLENLDLERAHPACHGQGQQDAARSGGTKSVCGDRQLSFDGTTETGEAAHGQRNFSFGARERN